MCQHDSTDSFRRGHKRMDDGKKDGDEFESHFKTSMLFTKSMKAL
ncbi:hypothetical protein [Candidatus Nitrosotenuis uzonensis]|uniref:Uncharacterized protein n=1 Tax=Candidatus Nitrosotenuis uzonensis TaxID=1407055 RepID=V6ATD1_9ARCH|nr:hypothetical protein [Candidatus Nitrosotenuis uzonensis]CAE6496961.1 conserved hypothetical protein [Candidatus Nitrosotenuis uzonensis]CDI05907.1 hypothetical protein NITUZ_40073 [Candidatus Nitrosotenuis uzonensis]